MFCSYANGTVASCCDLGFAVDKLCSYKNSLLSSSHSMPNQHENRRPLQISMRLGLQVVLHDLFNFGLRSCVYFTTM